MIGQEVIIAGIISDYTNLVAYQGPHIIKISENITGQTLEVKVWDSDWTNDYQTLFQNTPFFTHELKIIGTILIVNKNNNLLSLKLIFFLNFETKSVTIKKNGISIPICFAKNIIG